MKSTVAILLLILLGLLSCMLPLRYGLKRAARSVMSERIEKGAEEEVLIAAATLVDAQWEDQHEFRLHGQMFDVAGIEYRDGVKYLRCVTDVLETRLEQVADDVAFHLSASGRSNGRDQVAKAFSDWLQGLYLSATPDFRIGCRGSDAGRLFFPGPGRRMEDPFSRSIIVPPEA